MSFQGSSAFYCSSAKYAAVTAWATGVAKSVGNLVRQTAPTSGVERVFICTVAGTTQASEPSWSTTVNKGDQFAEASGPTWVEITGIPAVNGDMVNTPPWLVVKNNSIQRGHIIKDAAGTHLFVCTTAGNAGNGAEPTWNTSAVGNTTTDNTTTWTYIGTSFPAWGAPYARILQVCQFAAPTAIWQYFIGHDHNETQSSTISWTAGGSSQAARAVVGSTAGPVEIICVNTSGSTPPVAADLATTAAVTVTGASSIGATLGFLKWAYGLNLTAGTAAGSLSIDCGGASQDRYFESCKFTFGVGTGSGCQFRANTNQAQGKVHYKNCTFKYNHAGQQISAGSKVVYENCILDTSIAVPTTFFTSSGDSHFVRFIGMDLSALSGSAFTNTAATGEAFTLEFIDCKLPSSFTLATLFNQCTSARITFVRCDNGTNTFNFSTQDRSGLLTTDTGIVCTGGASDGTTPFSWKIVTTAFACPPQSPFETPQLANYNTSTSSLTATFKGIVNDSALPTNADVYANVYYLGSGSSPLGTTKSNRVTDFLATTTPANLTADTTAWDSHATARANSHAYSVGDIIKTASNSGRIFFCTSAGTSAVSEPGGYATAVDGGSVTDSGATFRAGVRFSFTVSLSSPAPALAGNIYSTVNFGKLSTTYFIDPRAVLT